MPRESSRIFDLPRSEARAVIFQRLNSFALGVNGDMGDKGINGDKGDSGDNGDLGRMGKSFSLLGLENRPYLDLGLRAFGEADDAAVAREKTLGRIAIGCALPNVHVEDRSDEANVANELLDMNESLWNPIAFEVDVVAESMKNVSPRSETLVSMSGGLIRRLCVFGGLSALRWGFTCLLWLLACCGMSFTVGVSTGEGGGTFPTPSILGGCKDEDDDAEVERNDVRVRLSGRVWCAAALWRLTRGKRAGGGG